MNPKLLLPCLLLLAGSTVSSQAAVLFSDNFDATSNQSPNDQLTNPGRQGGSLATLGYLQSGNVQIGNVTTLPPGPGSDLGDEFLAAFGGRAFIDHDFSSVTVPISISFHGLISSISTDGPGDWVSFSVGNAAGVPFVNGAAVSSILFRANGGTELWNNGSNGPGASSAAPGFDVWSQYKIILSDTAGTGSAFGTGGSRADYYVNGTLLGTQNLSQLSAGQGYFGFAANRIVGYDNLVIETVPEPSSALIGIGGLGCLALLRRRK